MPFLAIALILAGCTNRFDDGTDAIEKASASVRSAEAIAAADPARPAFHFRPPAYWMNDPNGTIFHDGYLQLFYQHNPYGDEWGHMHWGHARSRDLVHWEHLPIALWPSGEAGEEHCFSGSAALSGEGWPMLFYTSVAPREERAFEQWAAFGSSDWMNWQKHPGNPVLALARQGDPRFGPEWRDPFLFRENGRTFMALGADLEDRAVIPLYEAEDPSLLNWKYRGILFDWPKSQVDFPECPNFFRLGDRWVLIISPYRRLEYWIGTFSTETARFVPERQGTLDFGSGESANFYASNIAFDGEGRCWLLGWIRGFPAGRGWNGCLALPRILSLDDRGHLSQEPVPALSQLRGGERRWDGVETAGTVSLVDDFASRSGEIRIRIELGDASRAGLRFTGNEGAEVSWDGEVLEVAGSAAPVRGDTLELRAFLDKSVLEVFADGGRVVVSRVAMPSDTPSRIEFFAEGGQARIDARFWELETIWPEPQGSEEGSR